MPQKMTIETFIKKNNYFIFDNFDGKFQKAIYLINVKLTNQKILDLNFISFLNIQPFKD
jgi:hypothetical protein